MEVKAQVNNLRMSPRKVRLVVDLVRGRKIASALSQLQFCGKAASLPISKLVKSAVANAKNNYDLAEDNLFIKAVTVDGGPTIKRWAPKAHGRATPIRKRTSHVTVVLGELVDSGVKTAKKQDIEKPVELKSAGEPKSDKGLKIAKSAKPKATGTDEAEIQDTADHRGEGRHGHLKLEGNAAKKGHVGKLFQRKSG